MEKGEVHLILLSFLIGGAALFAINFTAYAHARQAAIYNVFGKRVSLIDGLFVDTCVRACREMFIRKDRKFLDTQRARNAK